VAIIQDLPFPSVTPILLEDGTLHPAWREFFYALWLRTGGDIEEEIPEEGPVTSVTETNGLVLTSGTLSFDPSQLDHDSLLNWEATRHVDHAQIDVIAGIGLLGGGPITTDVTLQVKGGTAISVDSGGVNLNITKLAEATPAADDHIAIYDASASLHRKVTVAGILADAVASLDDLTDVTIVDPETGDLLQYIDGEWVNESVATGGTGEVITYEGFKVLLEGDEQSGTDALLLSGDASPGKGKKDYLILSGEGVQLVGSSNIAVAVLEVTETFFPPSYTVATLPSAGEAGQFVFVADETGGATMAFSDGTDWRRVQDRAVVS
jgi:hypothetical protein